MVLAIVFPGQGSQKVGMLKELFMSYEIIRNTFEEASSTLKYNIWKLIQNNADMLKKTIYAQPAILTSSVAIWRLWRNKTKKTPSLLAGHSLGEYSALVCADSINFESAIKLVKMRSKFMLESTPHKGGAMSAIIGLKKEKIYDICKTISNKEMVFPVNFNSKNQIIISGHKLAVKKANDACKNAGAKLVFTLPIEVPSHCILMRPAAKKLSKLLEEIDFNIPKIPVVHNFNISIAKTTYSIKQALEKQLYYPVNWVKIVQYFIKFGINKVYEFGPRNILNKITKENNKKFYIISVNDVKSLKKVI